MSKFSLRVAYLVCVFCAIATVAAPTDTFTTLASFDGPNGSNPLGSLVQGLDGNLYGTTEYGGANNEGTVFEITPEGTLTMLYSFCSQSDCTDGGYPNGDLVQATNGNFYGATSGGGTVFSLATGLEAFVETLPTSGKVGAVVKILGNNLTGATSVTINGTSATFTVVSSTEITTNVPSGATSGKVTVTTPSATLTSNRKFQVR